jgi:predicted enzyme related to lactoylglutathione lyase
VTTSAATDGPEDSDMTISNNTFCWHGISTDVDQGKAFYTSVLGWQVAPDTDGAPMFVAPGGAVGHLQAPDGAPASWCSFLAVDDLDASTALAVERGGSLMVPPTPLPAGRFSVVTTPSGAVFGLYEADASDELAEPGPGSIHWVELQSTRPEVDVSWLSEVFGFTDQVEQMASGPYHVLNADGVPRGGVAASHGDRSAFVAWVEVKDLADTLEKVEAHGGRALGEPVADPAVGRMVVVADPAGATFGLVQPNAEA